MKLDKEGIKKILPHREPMLLVDTVEELRCCPASIPWNAWRRPRMCC